MKKPKRKRLRKTPHLDAWIEQLRLRLEVPDARHKLIESLQAIDPRPGYFWQNRLAELLSRRRMPNGEFLLMISTCLKMD